MNKDPSDFMFQEYDKIASAYFGLSNQINDWFKAFVTIIGLPLTILAAVFKLGDQTLMFGLDDIPPIVSALLVMVALLGYFVDLTIVSMRMEMILYARTINLVRRWFAQVDKVETKKTNPNDITKFLNLPTSDSEPPFYQVWRAIFWQVLLIGLVDGLILFVAVQNLFHFPWWLSSIIGVLFSGLHWFSYRLLSYWREKHWTLHFPEDLTAPNY